MGTTLDKATIHLDNDGVHVMRDADGYVWISMDGRIRCLKPDDAKLLRDYLQNM